MIDRLLFMTRFLLPMFLLPGVGWAQPKLDRHGDPLPSGAIARLGTIQSHPYVKQIAFDADGKTVITSGDAAVRYWDLDNGRIRRLKVIPVREGATQAISADGVAVATANRARLDVRDLKQDKVLHSLPLPLHREVLRLFVSPDHKTILISVAFPDDSSKKYRMTIGRGEFEELPVVAGWLAEAAFSIDSKWMATSSITSKRKFIVNCWSTTTGAKVGGELIAKDPLALAPDGSAVLVRQNEVIRLIATATGRPLTDNKFPFQSDTQTAAFSPDGKLLAVSTGSDVALWDIQTHRVVWKTPGSAVCLAFSPDGKRLAGADDLVQVWDVANGKALWPRFGPTLGKFDHGQHLFTKPSGNRLATWSGITKRMQIWDWTTGEPGFSTTAIGRTCESAWLSCNGSRMHICTERRVQTWDVAEGKELRRFTPIPRDLLTDDFSIDAAQPSSDGKRIHVLLNEDRGRAPGRSFVLSWDVATGAMLERHELTLPRSRPARFLPDARNLIVHDQLHVANFTKRQAAFTAPTGFLATNSVGASPDGRLLIGFLRPNAPSYDQELVVWEIATARPLLRIPIADARVITQAISPDNRWLAIGFLTGIELWDLVEQKKVTFHAPHLTPDCTHYGPSFCKELQFLRDNKLIAGYADWTALVWELPETARRITSPPIKESTWDDLASDNPVTAHRAVAALLGDADKGLQLLHEKLKPAKAPDEAALRADIADLASATFSRRESAIKRLHQQGHVIEKQIEHAHAAAVNPEQKQRLAQLLQACRNGAPITADERRAIRAVAALERLGTPAARNLLNILAAGAESATLTMEAVAAFERLRP